MLKTIYMKQARKALAEMQPKRALAIVAKIDLIAADPNRRDLDIKALQGHDGYRLRVGDFRVIFTRDAEAVTVLWIGPRGEAY